MKKEFKEELKKELMKEIQEEMKKSYVTTEKMKDIAEKTTQNIKEKDNKQNERHTPISPADIIDITPQKESQPGSQTGGGGSR